MKMKNRAVYLNPQQELLNNGVAEVRETQTEEELRTLRFELETFVCEGQYARGLQRILDSYLKNLKNPEQPAVWVSGFFGSGKSHLVKMLRSLWVDTVFPEDQATARGIARRLDEEVAILLRELTTQGKRAGGLHAAAGKLGAGGGDSVRLALLKIVFRSVNLPEDYPKARFVMWLRDNHCLEAIQDFVERKGKPWEKELNNLYVSPVIAEALVDCFPGFSVPKSEVLKQLKAQFPNVTDISNQEMVDAIADALTQDGKFPCTLIALDEVQQYIGESADRTYRIQEVTEACSKHFKGALLFVATGQTSLSGTPQLQKLKDRFRISVELSDQDVDTVIREIILKKKPDAQVEVETALNQRMGEISRHLQGTRIEPRPDDQKDLVADYPLLPVRRRFWEKVLRAVDQGGTQGQLRNQLKVVYEAVQVTAEKELGTVVPADFIFNQLATDLMHFGVLSREVYETIQSLQDETEDGRLKSRLCALAFLIGRLPRTVGVDIGVRSTSSTLADLLVEDLTIGSGDLRKRVDRLLPELVEGGQMMQIDQEYRIQTPESSAWNNEYQKCRTVIRSDLARIAHERSLLLQKACQTELGKLNLIQGLSKVKRDIVLHFGTSAPKTEDQKIPIWIREGWSEQESSFEADAQAAGLDSPTIFVFIPKRNADDFQKHLVDFHAAKETLETKGTPNSLEGQEARRSMETYRDKAEADLKSLIAQLLSQEVRVLQGGGQEMTGNTLLEAVESAAQASLTRLFPQFDVADDPKWDSVRTKAIKGDGDALAVLGYSGNVDEHPVCRQVLQYVGLGKKGNDIRKHFGGNTFGWSQDAIDASLYLLVLTEHLQARLNGQPQTVKQLDRRNLGQTEFRVEAITLTAPQKIGIRKLLQEMQFKVGANDDLAPLVSQYLSKILDLARDAGGNAPLPEVPDVSQITELTRLSGNEQLLEVFTQKDQLSALVKQWQQIKEAIAQRKPQWIELQRLLSFADRANPSVQEIQKQADAIVSNRLLLQTPNPISSLCESLTQILRTALVQVRSEFQQTYTEQLGSLQATDEWQQLEPDVQDQLLNGAGLEEVPAIATGNSADILSSLQTRSLSDWQTQREALSQKFQQTRVKAAKRIKPEAKPIQLPSATVSTPEEVDCWLAQAREMILENLKQGPVIL